MIEHYQNENKTKPSPKNVKSNDERLIVSVSRTDQRLSAHKVTIQIEKVFAKKVNLETI